MVDVASLQIKVSTDGIDAASSGLNRVTAAGKGAEGQNDKIVNSNKRLSASFSETDKYIKAAAASLGALGAGFTLVSVIQQLHQAGMAIERLNNSFAAATGSIRAGAEAMAFARSESQRLGLDLKSTADGYMKLSAASKGTSLEGAKTQALFRSVAGASTALGLSADQTNGALMALQQMMSKGTVQAEELRGQLGERLPGAFQIAARAMGVSTAELGKMLESGKVISEDFLPKFAAELEKTFPPGEKAMAGLTAETNRLKTAWFELNATVMESGGDSMFAGAIRGMKALTEEAAAFVKTIGKADSRILATLMPGVMYGAGKLTGAIDSNKTKPPLSAFDRDLAGGVGTGVGPSGGMSYMLGDRDNIIAKEVTITGAVVKEEQTRRAARNESHKAESEAQKAMQRLKDQIFEQTKNHIGEITAAQKEQDDAAHAAFKDRIQEAELKELWAKRDLEAIKAIAKARNDAAYLIQDLTIDTIEDPFEQQKARIDAEYQYKADLIQQNIDLLKSTQEQEFALMDAHFERVKAQAAEEAIVKYGKDSKQYKEVMERQKQADEVHNSAKIAAASKTASAISKLENIFDKLWTKKEKDKEKTTEDSFKSQLSAAANYVGIAGELLGWLADLQDQSSRKGFESAKAFNIAATIMSTAAGIMQQLAAPDGGLPSAWARAALVGVMGAIQVAKIASTSFGGGGSVAGTGATGSSASSGGGSQSGIAASSPLRSVADSQTQESLTRLTSSTDNVAVAIGRLSKTMDDFTAMFQTGGAGYTLATNAPNINTALTKPGKGPTDNFEAGVKWGSIVPVLGTTIGAVIGGIMDLFATKKWGTTAAGISLGMSGGDVTAQDYISQKKKGGWFSSDKKRTILSDNPDLQAYVGDMIGGYVNEIGRMALTLGTSADIDSYSAKATKIKTSGRKPEDIAKDLEDWTSKTLQGMALTVTGLESVAGSYANAYEQLKAYNDALVSTNDAFELIGKKQIQGNLVTAEFLNNMQNNLFGGMEEFTDAVDTYFSVMFTDTQQKAMEAAKATREVASVFESMPQIGTTFHRDGKWQKVADITYAQMAIPKTREEFTKLVDSLDLTTEVGAQTFAALMGVSEAFATMTNAAEEATSKLNTAFLDGAYDAASALKDILTGSLSTLTPQQQYMQQQAAFASAMANGNDAAIPGLSQSLLEASRAMFGSGTGYQSDYNLVTGQLGGMAGISGSITLDSTERQIKVITEMRDKVDEGTKETVAAIKALQAEVAALRNQASADAKKQIIAVNANGTQVADTVSGIVTATARA